MRRVTRDLNELRYGRFLWLLRECEHRAGADIVVIVVAIGESELGGGSAGEPEGDIVSDSAGKLLVTRETQKRWPGCDIGEYEW